MTMTVALKPNSKNEIGMKYVSPKKKFFTFIPYELAITLVNEGMAKPLSAKTIVRLFDNKDFKNFIMERDKNTCHYCGGFGDTLDHKLPKSKGGHTTPVNCVCACTACNLAKGSKDYEEFISHRVQMKNEGLKT